MRSLCHHRAPWLLFAFFINTAFAAEENPVTRLDLPRIEVITSTPLPGIGLSPKKYAANVQTLSAEDLGRSGANDVASMLERSLSSASMNSTQGNPLLADLNLRGFAASPILGTPQGVSIFLDGVRVNQAFGDTVDWDLIARNAIANISVIPGSNPLFGLNTLGGAVAIATKSGHEFPGVAIEAGVGSFGRRNLGVEYGVHGEKIDAFVAGNIFDQRGWSAHSPARVRQLFAKTGYQDNKTDVDLSLAAADNRIEATQTLPVSWLDTPRTSYSYPDATANRALMLNLKASHYLDKNLLVGANIYYRRVHSSVFNSNINDDFDPALAVESGNLPAENAINAITERRPGAAVQLTYTAPLIGRENTLTVGASYERGRIDFEQNEQEAPVSADGGTYSDAAITPHTLLKATNANQGWYATDTIALTPQTFWTLSGRYNRATVVLNDQIGTALNGHHRFSRFNPATGLTFNPNAQLTTFVGYNEGMRAPTAVELSCADPDAPCSLPNAFASDPELKPVISRTFEIGARARSENTSWFLAAFNSELSDDIQFVSSGGTGVNAGYFQNVGKTRRRGIESGAKAQVKNWQLNATYSYTEATFRTPLILTAPDNSSAAPLSCAGCTEIAVQPGDRLPGIPQHLFKFAASFQLSPRWAFGGGLSYQSGIYARGDENNSDVHGRVPGYTLVNLEGRYKPAPQWELVLRIENLFNRTASNYGQLGRNVFTAQNRGFDYTATQWRPEQFRSVVAPRLVGLSLRYATDSEKN